MNKQMWKYELELGEQTVDMPTDAIPCSVLCQDKLVVLYVAVSTAQSRQPLEHRKVVATVAGRYFDSDGLKFIGSVERRDGPNICWWHVWAEMPKEG